MKAKRSLIATSWPPHERRGGSIALGDGGSGLFPRWIVGDGRGTGPHEFRASLFHALDKQIKSLRVVGHRCGTVVDTEVEVDDIPFPIAKPDIHLFETCGGRAAVGRGTMNIGRSRESLARGLSVAARDRITDEQHPRQFRIILYEVPGARFTGNLLAFVDGQVETAEVLLQGAFPSLLFGRSFATSAA